jgi:hypothetical protein
MFFMVQPAGSKLEFPAHPLNTLQRNLSKPRPFNLISLAKPLAFYASLLGKVALIYAQNHRLFPFFKELASRYQSLETLRINDYNAYIESVRKAFPREILTSIFNYAPKQAKDFLVEETKAIPSTQNRAGFITSTKSFKSLVDLINTRELLLNEFNFTFEELKNFISLSPDLNYVDLGEYNPDLIDDDFMNHLLNHCRGIRKLFLSNSTKITDATVLKIASLKEITVLDLPYCEITLMQNNIPITLPKTLTTLSLEGCSKITDKSLVDLPPGLKQLDLSHTSVRYLTLPAGLEWLSLEKSEFVCHDKTIFPQTLEVLNLNSCEVDGDPLGLKTLPDSLIRLSLVETDVDADGLLFLPKKLQYLDVQGCEYLDEACIPSLPQNLTTLIMPEISSSDSVEVFPKSIETLYFAISSISDAEINHLSPQLKELSICGTELINFNLRTNLPLSLTSLTLTWIRLDDQSLKHLSKSLQNLDIPGTFITDKGIEFLSHSLKNLTISDCRNITDEGMNFPGDLESLVLSDAIQVTDDGLLKLPSQLKKLSLDGSGSITGQCFKSFPRNIKSISLKNAEPELKHIQDLPSGLIELTLTCKLDDEALSCLPPNLKSLHLLGLGNDITLNGIKRLPKNLMYLRIDSCSVFRTEWLADLPSTLVQVVFFDTSVEETGLKILTSSKFQNFKQLIIGNSPKEQPL